MITINVVIVGGGPSGLATAIKLKQLDSNLNVCLLEKASEIGAHILSGNVFETKALDELLTNVEGIFDSLTVQLLYAELASAAAVAVALIIRLKSST